MPRAETVAMNWGHGRKTEDFVCIYVVYDCTSSPIFWTPAKPNRKWYQTLTTPQNCIISPLHKKLHNQGHSLPRAETVAMNWGHGRKTEDFLCTYVVYNCTSSPIFWTLAKPNRKWYQTLTTPQNCIISPLHKKPTIRGTACLGPKRSP